MGGTIVDLRRDIDSSDAGRHDTHLTRHVLSIGETLAKNAVKVAAEFEFAVEARRTQGFIGHSRGMDGDERIAFRTAPQRSLQLLLLYRVGIGFRVVHGRPP